MNYYDNCDQLAWQAIKYDMLSNYYKYCDPQKHIYYYKKHLACMQRWVMYERGEGNGMGMGNAMGNGMGMGMPNSMGMGSMGNMGMAKVRVLHASPDAPAVDVYVNGQQILENISYQQKSEYISVPGGQYQIEIYPAGKMNQPVLSQMVMVEPGKMYTVAAADTLENLRLIAVLDSDNVSPGQSKVRVWHLSPNAPAVDIAVKGGDVLFRNVPFGKATRYLTLPPTTSDLEVRIAGTEQPVLTIPEVTLEPNQVYTATAVGLAGEDPPLEAVFLQP
ncbi:DUF4397 domain-containing protein [Pseudalkalibacillus sp. Hm43]|uniref:DUF4397 domain-containing protein n=1 Tax=Pseudalkalibacillus sp. Hm43 TaxID=3450742 RepID=UPI003F42EC0E